MLIRTGIWSLFAAAILLGSGTANAAQSGNTVFVDAWFNSQQRINAAGVSESYHYKWNDKTDSGFSLLGEVFRNDGVATETLASEPTLASLQAAQLYIIASPDIPAKNPHPHYMNASDAAQIAEWVHQGGVLVMMENDPANADIEHFNLLADRFGIHFNPVLSHHVIGSNYAMGRMRISGKGPVFHQPHTIFMKDTCTISLQSPAVAVLRDRGDIIMATTKYGKGTVFAVADPWLYNEYTDGHKLPAEYDNLAAGKELVHWLIEQAPHGKPRQ